MTEVATTSAGRGGRDTTFASAATEQYDGCMVFRTRPGVRRGASTEEL